MIRSLLFLLALLALSPFTASGIPQEKARGPTLGEEVNDAIKAGVKFLRTKQKKNGSFDSDHSKKYPDGVAALCMLAMLKSKVLGDDPAVQKTLAYLKYQSFTHTYSTAVRIMALDALQDPDNVPTILAAAEWLADNFRYSHSLW